jgi:hypothetical protein
MTWKGEAKGKAGTGKRDRGGSTYMVAMSCYCADFETSGFGAGNVQGYTCLKTLRCHLEECSACGRIERREITDICIPFGPRLHRRLNRM